MGRKIVIDTDDLKDMLEYARNFKHTRVYDSDINTDGEGVWHCDVEFFDCYTDDGDPAPDMVYSFDEHRDKLDEYNKAMKRQAEINNSLMTSLSSLSATTAEETTRNE